MVNHNEVYVWQLFAHAYEGEQVEAIRKEMKNMQIILQEQPRFLEILKSPAMTIEKKKEWFKATFSDQTSTVLMDFLMTLIEEEKFDDLEEIATIYDQLVSRYLEEQFNIVEGNVYSAIPLADDQVEKLEHVFTNKLQKQVKLGSIIDSSLIAGYRVELQGRVYDDTVGLQVQQLKESLRK